MKIRVADFSDTPAGRNVNDGPTSGETFRVNQLEPALKKALALHEDLVVVIDGVEGYGSSFLEEAFGGLVRSKITDKKTLRSVLKIEFEDPYFDLFKDRIFSYIDEA